MFSNCSVRFLLLLLLSAMSLAQAQTSLPSTQNGPCGELATVQPTAETNLFSEQQEEWLGDIMDQSIRRDFNVIEDPDGRLQKIGERLLAQLPPSRVHYHFAIIDSRDLNAFGLMGGRIYVHRRMIAFTRTEDELAALLGHEIGHMITHQVAIDVSRWFGELGITSLGDRQDVFEKWNKFKDNAAKLKDDHTRRREQQEQLIADRIGLYAMMRAGYDPAQFITFADRSLETKGRTGGFWSDFFGITHFESKRLREIIRNSGPLAAECIASKPDTSGFAKWQQATIEAKKGNSRSELPGLVKVTNLQSPLRPELDYMQFSPDGKYLLAQDESSIFVLTREPFASLFRIDADGADRAQFSPDSRSIVFFDSELRVQKWEIASRQRSSVHEVTVPLCLQTSLSPDGNYLACIDDELQLQIVAVDTNTPVLMKKKFYTPERFEAFLLMLSMELKLPMELFEMHYSPDGRYFLAGHGKTVLAYDLKEKHEVQVSRDVKKAAQLTFTFVSPEEIAGVVFDGGPPELARVPFPSGVVTDKFPLNALGKLSAVPSRDALLIRPAGTFAVGVVDLKAHKITVGFKTPGFAVYGPQFAGEQQSGEVGLFNSDDKASKGKVQLPESPLAASHAVAFSPDGEWLAVSGRSRGSVWKVDSGDRIFLVHAFDGATFDQQDRLTAKFPKYEKDPSRVFQFDPAGKGVQKLYDLDHPESRVFQASDVLVTLGAHKDKHGLFTHDTVIGVRDVHTNKLLWERTLEKTWPSFSYSQPGKTLTLIVGGYDSIKTLARNDPLVKSRLTSVDPKDMPTLLEAFDATTGKPLGAVMVNTGKHSFKVRWAQAVGDNMLVADSNDRMLVYSLKSGEQKGHVQGVARAVSRNGDRMLVEKEKGVADIYDMSTLRPLTHFVFSTRLTDAEFMADGTLLVLSADQKVYRFRPKEERATAETQ